MLITETPPVKSTPFPKLMCTSDGTIVFFQHERIGTVLVKGGNMGFTVGDHFKQFDMRYFYDYNGTITIQNS